MTWLWLVGVALGGWEPADRAVEPFNEGVRALEAARPAEAEGAFRAALDKDGACGRCAQGLGLALVRQQRLEDGIQTLRRALAAHPGRPELETALAGALFAAQAFEEALAHAQRAATLDGGSVDAHVALVQILLRQGQPGAARQALQAARLPGPERACLDLLIGLEEGQRPGSTALAICRQAAHPGLASTVLARAGGPRAAEATSPTAKVAASLRAHQAGQDEQALGQAEAALALEPRRADARMLKAISLGRLGRVDEALAELQRILDAEAWITVHAGGEMSGVLTASDEASLRAGMGQVAGLLASLLVERGRLDEAEAVLRRAVLDPGPSAEQSSAAVRLRRAQGRLPEAWSALAQAFERWPDHPDLQLLLIELNAQQPEGVPEALRARAAGLEDWRSVYGQASALARAGEHRACAERLGRVRLEVERLASAEDRLTVRRLWHGCAVNADWQAEADRAAEALGSPEAMNEVARIEHARLRLQSGDPTGARRLLQGLQASTEARREKVALLLDEALGAPPPSSAAP